MLGVRLSAFCLLSNDSATEPYSHCRIPVAAPDCILILLSHLQPHILYSVLIQSHRIKPRAKSVTKACPYSQRNTAKNIWVLSAFWTLKLAFIFKGHWILNSSDPYGDTFTMRTWMKVTVHNWLRCIVDVCQSPDPCLLSLMLRDLRLSGRWRQNSSDCVVLRPVSSGSVYSQPSCTRQQLCHWGNNSNFSRQYMRLGGAIKRMLQKKHWGRLPAPLLCTCAISPKNTFPEHNCPW